MNSPRLLDLSLVPDAVILLVIERSRLTDLVQFQRICKRFYHLIAQYSLLWKNLLFNSLQRTVIANLSEPRKEKKTLKNLEELLLTENEGVHWKERYLAHRRSMENWTLGRYTCSTITDGKHTCGGVFSLSFKSNILVTSSFDRSLLIWDLNEQREDGDTSYLSRVKGHTGFVWSINIKRSPHSSKTMMYSTSQTGDIALCDISDYLQGLPAPSDPQLIRFKQEHKGSVLSSLIDKYTGEYLISCGSDSTVRLWDIERLCQISLLGKHLYSVQCIANTSHDPFLLASGSTDRFVSLWDYRSPCNPCLQIQTNSSINSLDFKNQHYLFSGDDQGHLRIHDLRYQSKQPLKLQAHPDSIRTLVNKNNRLVTTSNDNTIKVFNSTNPTNPIPLFECKGHTGSVVSMKFNKDRIITGSLDSTIKIWNF